MSSMRIWAFYSSAALAVAGLAGCAGTSKQATMTRCEDFNGLAISSQSIGLPTQGAKVTRASLVPAGGSGAAAFGEYCEIQGEIDPVDDAAPKIKFQVNLPSQWNGKAIMFGGGGYNGTIAAGAIKNGNVPAGPVDRPTPLGRGYASFGSDSGHQANELGSQDGRFGANDEALNNFSRDALKKTRDAAMTLVKRRYGQMPQRTYFAGGSTGGREALLAVSLWPQDFDGAIALYPAWDAVSLDLYFGHVARALAKPGAYPNQQKRQTLLDYALAACDALDGVKDGVVANVPACEAAFDPTKAVVNGKPLRCAKGADTGDDCLSDAQIGAFRAMNRPMKWNYRLASGESTYPGFNVWGADFGRPLSPNANPAQKANQPIVAKLSLGAAQPATPMPAAAPYGSVFWDQWVKYFVTRDANHDALSIDPVSPGLWRDRIVKLSAIQEVTQSDLSAFQARGGKLLIAHGTADALVSNRSTQRFMARLIDAMGAEKVGSFVRYYEIPGYGHAYGTVFNAAWDSLTALEDWVEKGLPPTNQIVADTAGVPGRTRPLCEFPGWPKYRGSGDVDVAASYVCADR